MHALANRIYIFENSLEIIELKDSTHVEIFEIKAIKLIEQTALCKPLHNLISLGSGPLLLSNQINFTINSVHFLFNVPRIALYKNRCSLCLRVSLLNVLSGFTLYRQVLINFLDLIESLSLFD